jgi:hypothetical protein
VKRDEWRDLDRLADSCTASVFLWPAFAWFCRWSATVLCTRILMSQLGGTGSAICSSRRHDVLFMTRLNRFDVVLTSHFTERHDCINRARPSVSIKTKEADLIERDGIRRPIVELRRLR